MHGEAFHAATAAHPEIWTWVTFGPFTTTAGFLTAHESYIRSQPDRTLFAAFDTSRSEGSGAQERLAGLIGLMNTSVDNLCTEVAFGFTLPPFQRTHVTTHAVGLLLSWCFDELKLRRVQWQTNEGNERSWRAAMKVGFKKEGVKRWDRALPPGKGGQLTRDGDPRGDWLGRHTVLLAICWDDWEDEVKSVVHERMNMRDK